MHKCILSFSIVFSLFTTLSGCIVLYIPPTNGPLAQLSVHHSSVDVAVYGDAIQCTGGPRPLHPPFVKTEGRFVAIPAEKPLTLRVITQGDERASTTYDTLTFIPEAGKKYTVGSRLINGQQTSYLRVWTVLKNGKSRDIPIRYIKRQDTFWSGCSDEYMKESIRRISTSYQKN
ncbi:MAG: hypothetical protein QM652_05945 [Legionella sp.]|uniref:hypothetical protein n=1 Tax=Legionella sp. TaxID=459 RepID=UPI0039E5BDD2